MSLAGIFGGIAAGSILSQAFGPLTTGLEQGLNQLVPIQILSPNDLIDLHHRKGLTTLQYYELMERHGFNYETAKAYYYAKDSLLTPEQAAITLITDRLDLIYYYEANQVNPIQQRLDRRDLLVNYFDRMKAQGYRQSEAQDFFRANRPLPTFSTILEWLAKEVFEPDKIATFGLDQEQPPALTTYMSAYGVPNEEARKYWIAHWNTIGRGGWDEMYQRFSADRRTATYDDIDSDELAAAGVTWDDVKITQQNYNDYYTVLELSPYFRNRGRGAVYRPLPFSVLQQLWQYGVLTYRQMVGRLRDYGYSKPSAELILEAWQRKFPYGYKEPIRDNILKKYELAKISRTTANTQLQTAGVSSDARTFLLDSVDDKLAEKNIQYSLKSLERKLMKLEMSDTELTTAINAIIGSSEPTRTTFELSVLKAKVQARTQIISFRTAGKAYGNGNMSKTEFTAFLRARYYSDSEINVAEKAYRTSNSNTA